MNHRLAQLIDSLKSWPDDRQNDAVAMLQAMADQSRAGPYALSDDERAQIDASREQARRGEFAGDGEIAAVLSKHGL